VVGKWAIENFTWLWLKTGGNECKGLILNPLQEEGQNHKSVRWLALKLNALIIMQMQKSSTDIPQLA
jgi:hypothetical protein